MRRSRILTALSAAFLAGVMMSFGLVQLLDSPGGSSTSASAATSIPASTGASSVTAVSSQVTLSAAQIYAAVRPSVVEIDVTAVQSTRRFRQQEVQGTGTGIVIDTNGDILTNYHVIDGAQTIEVRFSDGSTEPATVAGGDATNDLAVVKVDPSAHSLVPAKLGDSSTLRVGDTVLALGNPFNLEGTLTEGIVSGLDRNSPQDSQSTLNGLIQTDAAVNPGNSGGPLINMQGQVIGINALLENPTGESVNVGVAFAIPINTATHELSSLIAG